MSFLLGRTDHLTLEDELPYADVNHPCRVAIALRIPGEPMQFKPTPLTFAGQATNWILVDVGPRGTAASSGSSLRLARGNCTSSLWLPGRRSTGAWVSSSLAPPSTTCASGLWLTDYRRGSAWGSLSVELSRCRCAGGRWH
jgi:hypothetical protein